MEVTRIDYKIVGHPYQSGQDFYENRAPIEAIVQFQTDASKYNESRVITAWAWFSRFPR